MKRRPVEFFLTDLSATLEVELSQNIHTVEIRINREDLLSALGAEEKDLKAMNYSASEVLRCRECKYRIAELCHHPKGGDFAILETSDNDFCSNGERRNDA